MAEPSLIVKAQCRDYAGCPMCVRLEAASCPAGPVELLEPSSGQTLPAQWLRCGEALWLAWIVPSLARGQEKSYVLRPCAPKRGGVRLKERDGRVQVTLRGKLFTAYYLGADCARPFLHPLVGPGGAVVTRRYPMEQVEGETRDHAHHKGCWVAWGDVNGNDDWSEGANHATVRHQRFEALESGAVLGRLVAFNHWLAGDGGKLLEERREYRFYNLPGAARAFDLAVTFRASEGKVRFGDTKEGGMGSIRVATSMDGDKGGLIENSYGGVREGETWGKRAHWCDYSGPVGGATVGVAIMDHPANLRHPTYWHVRDYGLMTANPFGSSHFLRDKLRDGSHALAPGDELTFRYRVFIHRGDAARGKVAAQYHHYINPPHVRLG